MGDMNAFQRSGGYAKQAQAPRPAADPGWLTPSLRKRAAAALPASVSFLTPLIKGNGAAANDQVGSAPVIEDGSKAPSKLEAAPPSGGEAAPIQQLGDSSSAFKRYGTSPSKVGTTPTIVG